MRSRNTLWLITVSVLLSSTLPLAHATDTQQSRVLRVIDGDTVQVKLSGKTEKVRIIGIDTPETVDPRKPMQCYGKEAAAKMKKLLTRKNVVLEQNPAEDRDKYKRLLRYVSLKGEDIGATMIREGYAFSYKEFPHPRLEEYNAMEQQAKEGKKGLWGAKCNGGTSQSASSVQSSASIRSAASSARSSVSGSCTIKGNINSKDEHIYHLPGCRSYSATQIDTTAGEKWFCSEAEALAAGWRKALNCN